MGHIANALTQDAPDDWRQAMIGARAPDADPWSFHMTQPEIRSDQRADFGEGQAASKLVRAVLEGDYVTTPINRQKRARFTELRHSSPVQKREAKRIGSASALGLADWGYFAEHLDLGSLELSNKVVFPTMGVTANTLKYHLKTPFEALRASSRAPAVAQAARPGIVRHRLSDGSSKRRFAPVNQTLLVRNAGSPGESRCFFRRSSCSRSELGHLRRTRWAP